MSSARRPPLLLLLVRALGTASVSLPDGFEFRRVDVRSELRPLLHSSYIATPDDALRLDYTAADLQWMLDAPGANEELRVGIGRCGTPGIVAFVCAAPCELLMRGEHVQTSVEVSLLCVHRDWRGRGLTKFLLFELRRRARAAGVRCAIFTEARPRYTLPLLRADCFHRPLRPLALLRHGFWHPPEGLSGSERELQAAARVAAVLPRHAELLAGRSAAQPPLVVRRMRRGDVEACHALFEARAQRFALAPAFSQAQFRHRFLGAGAHSLVLVTPRAPRAYIRHALRLGRRFAGARARAVRRALRLGQRFGRGGGVHDGGGDGAGDGAGDGGGWHGREVLGFGSFSLLPLLTADGERLVQAQLLGISLAPKPSGSNEDEGPLVDEAALMALLGGLLRRARAVGAHVFNAHALAELTPSRLQRLGFGQGDEASYVCLDDAGGPPLRMMRDAPLDPTRACWLPLL